MGIENLTNEDIANILIDQSNCSKAAVESGFYEVAYHFEVNMDENINELIKRGLKREDIVPLMQKVSDDNIKELNNES